MTPKEKAKELYDKYATFLWYGVPIDPDPKYKTLRNRIREVATICVDEILNLRMIGNMGRGFDSVLSEKEYWVQVKKEIQKL